MEKSNPLKKTQGLTHLFTHNLNFIYSLILRETERERDCCQIHTIYSQPQFYLLTFIQRERDSTKIEFVGRKKERLPRKLMEIVHTPPLALLPSSKCMRTRSVQIDFCLLLFSSFLILIQFWCYNLTIFMRTRLYFDYSFSFREIFRD